MRRSALIDDASVGFPLAGLVRGIFLRMPRRRPTICFQIGTRLARPRSGHESALALDWSVPSRRTRWRRESVPTSESTASGYVSKPAVESLPHVVTTRTNVSRWISVPVSPI